MPKKSGNKNTTTKNVTVADAESNIVHTDDPIDPNQGIDVKEPEQGDKVHPDNEDLMEREWLFPQLSKDYGLLQRRYPDPDRHATEMEFKNFKQNIDLSIPVHRIITKVIRIRTMSNKDQELKECICYYANLYGFKKAYVQGKLQEFPSGEASDVPFGFDLTVSPRPEHKNGEIIGYAAQPEQKVYNTEFKKGIVDEIMDKGTLQEGVRTNYILEDAGVTYGEYSREEINNGKIERLVYRNSNKLNGTEMKDEDLISK